MAAGDKHWERNPLSPPPPVPVVQLCVWSGARLRWDWSMDGGAASNTMERAAGGWRWRGVGTETEVRRTQRMDLHTAVGRGV